MKEWLNYKLKGLPMEIRILVFASIGGALFALLTGMGNVILNLGMPMVIVAFGTGIMSVVTLYFALVKESYTVPVYVSILVLVLIIYPTMWINNAGSHGPMAFFMIFNAIFCSLLLSYLNYKIILVLQLFVLYGLLILEWFAPEMIVPYPNEVTRFLDMGFSFTVVFLLTFFLVVKIMNEYNHNIKELEQVKQELLDINSKLVVISETDELTGICNRRYIMSILKRHLLLKDTEMLSLIMIDIDYFKSINDTYGHSVGDEVIKKVSDVLKKNIRRTDTLGRIGGEEFLIVLPNTPLEAAYKKAEQLRQTIDELRWEYDKMHVTISGGAYCNEEGETLDELLENVDKQLYLAKNSGRNKIKTKGTGKFVHAK